MTPDDFSRLVRERRSVRDFRPDPVPADILDQLIADAAWAPSWSNTQPYLITIATGAVRDRLAGELCARYDAAAAAQRGNLWDKLRLVASRGLPSGDFDTALTYPDELQPYRRSTGYGLYSVLGIERSDRAARDRQLRRNFEFFGAPVALFVFVHAGLKEFSVLDAGGLIQTLLLSARVHGLGSCAQGALATWPQPVRAEFDVPDHYKLICGVSLGYAADAPVNEYNPGRRKIVHPHPDSADGFAHPDSRLAAGG